MSRTRRATPHTPAWLRAFYAVLIFLAFVVIYGGILHNGAP